MSGPKQNQSKGKASERVQTPELQSSSPLVAEPATSVHSQNDLATQLHKLETRYKAALRTSSEAKDIAEINSERMVDIEKQIGHMVDAINGITNSVNALRTVTAANTSSNTTATQYHGDPNNLANLKIVLDDIDPVTTYEILCDNQAAVLIATDNASRKKTRYLQRAFYFVNDFVRRNQVKLYWISNSEQLADIFTKRLAATKHREATSVINLADIPPNELHLEVLPPWLITHVGLTASPPFIQPSVHRLGGRRGLKVRLTVKQPVIQRRWSNQAVSPTVVRLLDHRRDSPNGGTRLVPTILRPYRQATVNTVGARCGIRPTVVQPTPIKGGGPVVTRVDQYFHQSLFQKLPQPTSKSTGRRTVWRIMYGFRVRASFLLICILWQTGRLQAMGNLDDVASTSKAAELQVSRTSHEQQPAINLYTLRESVLANAETNALV
ncbi:hypothetical protein PCASD_12723 [Puccinia coronata f. sp. avenae]|uniref:Uncharacterized protein n=1 Tax=Puccinia coronata f. sp. avenae TaxID=200324 RepID=A0A2N5UCM1_9BASI|nr:hypothetical protein PCASD_12723 [Puccinia coronata f. sp. avenae]